MLSVVVPRVRLRMKIVGVAEDISCVMFIVSRLTLVARKAGFRRCSVEKAARVGCYSRLFVWSVWSFGPCGRFWKFGSLGGLKYVIREDRRWQRTQDSTLILGFSLDLGQTRPSRDGRKSREADARTAAVECGRSHENHSVVAPCDRRRLRQSAEGQVRHQAADQTTRPGEPDQSQGQYIPLQLQLMFNV